MQEKSTLSKCQEPGNSFLDIIHVLDLNDSCAVLKADLLLSIVKTGTMSCQVLLLLLVKITREALERTKKIILKFVHFKTDYLNVRYRTDSKVLNVQSEKSQLAIQCNCDKTLSKNYVSVKKNPDTIYINPKKLTRLR